MSRLVNLVNLFNLVNFVNLVNPPTHTRVAPLLSPSTRDGEPKDEEDEVVVKMFCP